MQAFLKLYPQAKWHVYEPANCDNGSEGAKLAFGQPVETRYDFSRWIMFPFAGRGFFVRRISGECSRHPRLRQPPQSENGDMSRLCVVESTPSPTGGRGGSIGSALRRGVAVIAQALAARVGVDAN